MHSLVVLQVLLMNMIQFLNLMISLIFIPKQILLLISFCHSSCFAMESSQRKPSCNFLFSLFFCRLSFITDFDRHNKIIKCIAKKSTKENAAVSEKGTRGGLSRLPLNSAVLECFPVWDAITLPHQIPVNTRFFFFFLISLTIDICQ